MKIQSDRQWENVPIEILKYDTFLKRLKGLMFQLRPIRHSGIHLEPCNSIHMFFMFFAIDVVFLDRNHEIVSLKKNVKPWSVIFPVKRAFSALELPSGTIEKYALKIGQIIQF